MVEPSTPPTTAPDCKCESADLVIIKAIADRVLVYRAAGVLSEVGSVCEAFLHNGVDIGKRMCHFFAACPPMYLTALCPVLRKIIVGDGSPENLLLNISVALQNLANDFDYLAEPISLLVKTDVLLVKWFSSNAVDWHNNISLNTDLIKGLESVFDQAEVFFKKLLSGFHVSKAEPIPSEDDKSIIVRDEISTKLLHSLIK